VNTRPKRRAAGWLGAAWAVACAVLSLQAHAAGEYSENAVKAAFLYRFADYIEWPPEAVPATSFVIAVLDDEGMARELEQLLPGHTIQGRSPEVHRITDVAQLGHAQMLYVGSTPRSELRAVADAVGTRPVLLVTDEERGLSAGSAVNFLRDGRRMRFEVSLAAAGRSGLRISSELLAVALRVHGAPLRPDGGARGNGQARGQEITVAGT